MNVEEIDATGLYSKLTEFASVMKKPFSEYLE